jgi:hypothetical protein
VADDSMRHPLFWPDGWKRTQAYQRRRNDRYKADFVRARDGILRALRLLRARHAVVSSNVPLRRDGLPLAGQREPNDPGIAVYWTSRDGKPQVIACDRWDRVKDNLHAVELALEAIRAIERSGASEILDRAFQGFAALPPSTSTTRSWRSVLGFLGCDGINGANPTVEEVAQRFRELARERHPDVGGSDEAFIELTKARDQALEEVGRG